MTDARPEDTPPFERPIAPEKAALIDWAVERYGARSLVDLGACWAVHGGYALHAARTHRLQRTVIVDAVVTDLTRQRARGVPGVEIVDGMLADDAVVEKIGKVDVAVMFDILLHQVSPDWDGFLARYAELADTLVIYNQNWLGPRTVRFVDLGLDEYLRRVPHTDPSRVRDWFASHDEYVPEQDRPRRDVFNFWQWGITEKDLVGALWDLGHRIDHLSHYGPYDLRFPEVEVVGLVSHTRDRPAPLPDVAVPGPAFAPPPAEEQATPARHERRGGTGRGLRSRLLGGARKRRPR